MKDYTIRMREYFGHLLKGEDAPDWWTEGVPHLEMEDHLKERAALVKPKKDEDEKEKKEKKPEKIASGEGGSS